MKSIVLSGSPLALPALRYLFETGQLSALICPEDSVACSDTALLHDWAVLNGVPCWSMPQENLEKELSELITETVPDFLLVFGFPYALPKSLLQHVKYNCWNVHFSLQQVKQGSVMIHHLKEDQSDQLVLERKLPISKEGEWGSPLQQLSLQVVDLLKESLMLMHREVYIERYFRVA